MEYFVILFRSSVFKMHPFQSGCGKGPAKALKGEQDL